MVIRVESKYVFQHFLSILFAMQCPVCGQADGHMVVGSLGSHGWSGYQKWAPGGVGCSGGWEALLGPSWGLRGAAPPRIK